MSDSVKIPLPPTPEIDYTTYTLPKEQYVDVSVEKTGIVLHHTVSSSVSSVYNWWLDKGRERLVRVGTSYVIDKDGTIYCFFPDDRWAWHLGRGVSNEDEARTIGIELVSEGGLVKIEDKKYKAFYNPKTKKGVDFDESHVEDLGTFWRGFRYFDRYEHEQILSLIALVYSLCDKYNIPRQMPSDLWRYKESIKKFEGVFTHAQVRMDKTDLHPNFPIEYFCKWAHLEMKNV